MRSLGFGVCSLAVAAVAMLLSAGSVLAAGGPPKPETASASDLPPSAAPAVKICCDKRCIDYRYHGRPICCCKAPVKSVLLVKDPGSCTCCYVEVPVCLPGCCAGEPKVTCHNGLFNDGVATYTWCCGVKVRVVFHRCGDITVHYYRA